MMRDQSKYNGWNFTIDKRKWDDEDPTVDSFWYSINTTLLWHTETYKIGEEQIDMMDCYLTPEDFTLKNRNATGYFLGIPTGWKDYIYKNLIWTGTTDVTENWMVPKRGQYSSSDMIANINFEFTQRKYTKWYYGLDDILKGIGGIRSTVLPIIGFLIPFIVIYFLVLLADYVKWAAEKNYNKELHELATIAHKQLLTIRDASERMRQSSFNHVIMKELSDLDTIDIENEVNVEDENAEEKSQRMEQHVKFMLNLAFKIKDEIDLRVEGKDYKSEMTNPELNDWIMMQYMVEPIFRRVETLKHLTIQKNLNTIEFIGMLNKRGNLFAYFNLHDTVIILQKRLQAS